MTKPVRERPMLAWRRRNGYSLVLSGICPTSTLRNIPLTQGAAAQHPIDHMSRLRDVELRDYCPETDTFREDVLAGLALPQKMLPSKYFYDEEGSALFDRICELEVYYPTRTEMEIMEEAAPEMADRIGRRALIIEYGSGSSVKTRLLLDALADPAGYVPIDISREHLLAAARGVAGAYPDLDVMPVCADYTQDFPIPVPSGHVSSRVVYFPGSTVGNFVPSTARSFLDHVRSTADALLIGVDLRKDKSVLEAAYNDPEGVTAAFNKNLLRRMNRELGGDFELDAFEHRALFNGHASRIEMHLVSRLDQTVSVAGRPFAFTRGEHICTEYSHKYTVEGFTAMASAAGFKLEEAWLDARRYFSVLLYRAG